MERLVEGWTARLKFQLLKKESSGAAFVPFEESEILGTTVTLVLKTAAGVAVSTTGKVGWLSTADSTVYYDPGASDLLAAGSPYTAHWVITDLNGKKVYIPKNEADSWPIYAQ